MDILMWAIQAQNAATKSSNKDLEDLLREMVLRIKQNTKDIKKLEKRCKECK